MLQSYRRALPAVGGFISATLSLLIGIAHWGALGWQTWFLYGSGIAAHFIETKFLTPRIVGHAIDVPPFVMIGALLSGIAMNGAAGGFQALILLPILRAMIDDLSAGHAAVPRAVEPQEVSAGARPPGGQPGKPQNANKKKMRG